MRSDVDVRLLGPLEVSVAGSAVQFEGSKQRSLFTALALRAPEPVSVDELVEALWADDAPGDGLQALQKQVSRLRRRLGPAAPVSRGALGYVLEHRAGRDRRASVRGAGPAGGRRARQGPARSPRATTSRRRCRSGAARRSPTIASTSSRSSRSRGWRSCGSRRSRGGSPPSSPSAATPISSASCRRWWGSTRCASASAGN